MRSKQGLATRLSKLPLPKLFDRVAQLVDTGFGRRAAMSGTGLAAVLLMIGTVMIVVCFWKQIALFLLLAAGTVFCFGVYYIVGTIEHAI